MLSWLPCLFYNSLMHTFGLLEIDATRRVELWMRRGGGRLASTLVIGVVVVVRAECLHEDGDEEVDDGEEEDEHGRVAEYDNLGALPRVEPRLVDDDILAEQHADHREHRRGEVVKVEAREPAGACAMRGGMRACMRGCEHA